MFSSSPASIKHQKKCLGCGKYSSLDLCYKCTSNHFVNCVECLHNSDILNCECYIMSDCLSKYKKLKSLINLINTKTNVLPKKRKICFLCEKFPEAENGTCEDCSKDNTLCFLCETHPETENGACEDCNNILNVDMLV